MSVTINQITTESADSSFLDVAHTVGIGETLIVAVLLETTEEDKEVDLITWNHGGDVPEIMRPAFSLNPNKLNLRWEIWQIANPNPARSTIRVQVERGSQRFGVICLSLANVNTVDPIKSTAIQSGILSSGGVKMEQARNDLAIIFAGLLANESISPDGSETTRADINVENTFRMFCASLDEIGNHDLNWRSSQSQKSATVGIVVSGE